MTFQRFSVVTYSCTLDVGCSPISWGSTVCAGVAVDIPVGPRPQTWATVCMQHSSEPPTSTPHVLHALDIHAHQPPCQAYAISLMKSSCKNSAMFLRIWKRANQLVLLQPDPQLRPLFPSRFCCTGPLMPAAQTCRRRRTLRTEPRPRMVFSYRLGSKTWQHSNTRQGPQPRTQHRAH